MVERTKKYRIKTKMKPLLVGIYFPNQDICLIKPIQNGILRLEVSD